MANLIVIRSAGLSLLLLVLSVVTFVLCAFGVETKGFNLLDLGLAFFAGAFIF